MKKLISVLFSLLMVFSMTACTVQPTTVTKVQTVTQSVESTVVKIETISNNNNNTVTITEKVIEQSDPVVVTVVNNIPKTRVKTEYVETIKTVTKTITSTPTSINPVAKIGDKLYYSLAAASYASKANDVIELLKDFTIEDINKEIPVTYIALIDSTPTKLKVLFNKTGSVPIFV